MFLHSEMIPYILVQTQDGQNININKYFIIQDELYVCVQSYELHDGNFKKIEKFDQIKVKITFDISGISL